MGKECSTCGRRKRHPRQVPIDMFRNVSLRPTPSPFRQTEDVIGQQDGVHGMLIPALHRNPTTRTMNTPHTRREMCRQWVCLAQIQTHPIDSCSRKQTWTHCRAWRARVALAVCCIDAARDTNTLWVSVFAHSNSASCLVSQ